MKLLAVDTGSNKCGWALFNNGLLTDAGTIVAKGKPNTRIAYIVKNLLVVSRHFDSNLNKLVIEDPLLRGKGNQIIQRLIGAISYKLVDTDTMDRDEDVIYNHPMSVKKFLGDGKLEKLEMALECGNRVGTNKEKDLIAALISEEDFDATDAIANGLFYLGSLKLGDLLIEGMTELVKGRKHDS